MKLRMPFCLILCVLLSMAAVIISGCSGKSARWEQELSGDGWKLYLDREATWQQDILYLPPVDLSGIPVNPPTCGWEELHTGEEKKVEVPGTVEGYYWSVPDSDGNLTGDYRGISWWSTTFEVPSRMEGKRLILAFQSVNLRAEVFVNKKLVGYDVIGNTPFELNISDAVKFKDTNTLDVRITDIGGTFSWDDEKALEWGEYMVPSVHGFGGITGKVRLYATDPVYIDDIYVQNLPAPTEAKVFVTLGNSGTGEVDGTVTLRIYEKNEPGDEIWSQSKMVPA